MLDDPEFGELTPKRKAVADWLAAQGKRANVVEIEDLSILRTLFAPHKGFGVLWSLIAFERAQDMEELKNQQLSTEGGRYRAAVLQGQIKAVDRLYDLLLTIADPDPGAALDQRA